MDILYANKKFDNALNNKDDVIAFGAYKNGELVALAGADNRLSDLWQIGIDTLPEHRGKGLATYLVKELAQEIKKRGKVPFYILMYDNTYWITTKKIKCWQISQVSYPLVPAYNNLTTNFRTMASLRAKQLFLK